MNLATKYHKWRYDQLWKKIKKRRSKEIQEYKDRGENAPWKDGEEYLTVRQAKALENHGYKWWNKTHPASVNKKITDVTEIAAVQKEFSVKSDVPAFLERQSKKVRYVRSGVANEPSFWKENTARQEYPLKDTSTQVSFAYCQKGHMHEYHNGELQARVVQEKISKHLTVDKIKPINVPKSLFGLRDKSAKRVEACD